MLHRLIQLLSSHLKLRDLGTVHYFLGIEVPFTGMGLMLRQHKYILDILTRASMISCKPADTLVSPSKVTIFPDSSFSDPTRFLQIMGALQYLTFTHTDICLVVNRVCQFMHAPTDSHWTVVKRILRYVKGTTSYGFHFTRGSSFVLHGFTSADWLVVLIIASLRVATLSSLVKHRFHGNPASNAQLLASLMKLSIKP